MNIIKKLAAVIVLFVATIACAGTVETPTEIPPQPTPTITQIPATISASCEDIGRYWGSDWAALIVSLEQLRAAGMTCGEPQLDSKQYAAHFNFGTELETAGDLTGAINQYQLALSLDGTRDEAYEALTRLNALPPATPYACEVTGTEPLPQEEPVDPAQFVRVSGDQLILGDGPYIARGVNYYSRFAQWHRFLTLFDPGTVAEELTVISEAGFNSIRIFLWYEPMFTCAPEDAVPVSEIFGRLDLLLAMAEERGLKVIVTLNDLPDLRYRPLYTDYARYDAQTAYIVQRYKNNPTILAWDLRNEGDLDYGAQGAPPAFPHETVIAWVEHVSQIVRANDPNHLITAGWWGDPTITAPYVDVLSFHHWNSAEELAGRINTYRANNDKPLMLQEVGYHAWVDAPTNAVTQEQQAEILSAVIAVAEDRGLSGWLIWTAFDFVPYDLQYTHEHFFGLWDVNLQPKPALEALPLP